MKRLILVGAGHAHLHVLRALGAAPWPEVEVVLISPHPRQIYSGMVPGWIAGHYRLDQCVVRIEPLAAAARACVVGDALCGLDATQRIVHTQDGRALEYDVLSLDTGAGLALDPQLANYPGLLPIRPLESFVARWDDALRALLHDARSRLAVAGGGAAGVELALAIAYRLREGGGAGRGRVVLACGGGLLPGHARGVVARARKALEQQGVLTLQGRITADMAGVTVDGTPLAADWIVAATGVGPPAWLAGTDLALAPDGFVAVGEGQQSLSHAEVFAAGDVASRLDAPHAKSGVYAVRAGPVLARNLRRAIEGRAPLPYVPQRRSLYLLATGPKSAIVSWGGLSAGGRLAWQWKDWIDRRFMRRYQSAG